MGQLVQLPYRPAVNSCAVVGERCPSERLTKSDRLLAVPLAHRFGSLDQATTQEPSTQGACRGELIGSRFQISRIDKGLHQIKWRRSWRPFITHTRHPNTPSKALDRL